MARDHKGNAVGKGRVMWAQPADQYGPYMKVKLDSGATAIVPMRTSNALVKK